MRKVDLITAIHEKTGIPRIDVLITVEAFLKEIKDNMKSGENIYIRGFGSFILKKRAAKVGRIVKKNIAINIPEHHIPAFKPGKEFLQEVKKINFAEKK